MARAAGHEISGLLWNPKNRHRVQNSPPLALLLSHMKPLHGLHSYLSGIYFNIII
jgi:hypothetical protein